MPHALYVVFDDDRQTEREFRERHEELAGRMLAHAIHDMSTSRKLNERKVYGAYVLGGAEQDRVVATCGMIPMTVEQP